MSAERREFELAIERLLAAVRDESWTGDSGNQSGIEMDLGFAFETVPSFSNMRCRRDGVVSVVGAEWSGEAETIAAIGADFYRVLERVHEAVTFCEQIVETDAIRYRLILGAAAGPGRHGHLVEVRLEGQNVRAAVEKYRAVRAEWDALPRDNQARPIIRG